MGRRHVEQQGKLWIPTRQLPQSPGHVFYEKLNGLLAEAGFDSWVEQPSVRTRGGRRANRRDNPVDIINGQRAAR